MQHIVVIGSINMDLVCRTRALPAAGETVLGEAFFTAPGGKGANQAVAAARLARRGVDVHMIGRVGDDAFGRTLLEGLRRNRVRTDPVRITRGVASGVAMIQVDRRGENSIVVAPGANAKVSTADVDAARNLIARAAAVVMQLEIPLATVRHAITLCRRLGVFTILDPAPVPPKGLPAAMFRVDLLSPNENEALALSGQPNKSRMMTRLLERGAKNVALKLGARGAMFGDGADVTARTFRPFQVPVADTTAAGDAFTGALAVARAENMSPPQAMRFACAAGALCCTTLGAQPSLPTRSAVDALLRRTQKGR